METRELVKQLVRSLDKHKAKDIQVIRVADVTIIAEYFIIAAGTSSTQVRALADYAEGELKEQGVSPQRMEGYAGSTWVLIDYGSVIVHVFQPETREYYNLERLWKDGEFVDIAEFLEREED